MFQQRSPLPLVCMSSDVVIVTLVIIQPFDKQLESWSRVQSVSWVMNSAPPPGAHSVVYRCAGLEHFTPV